MSQTTEQIWTLIEVRRYEEAKQAIRDAFVHQPDNVELFQASSRIAWITDEFDEGIKICDQGLAYDPANVDLLFIKFNLLKSTQQYIPAEEIIIQLLASYPQDTDYLNGYAELMMKTFHLEKARTLCNETLRLEPEHSGAKSLSYLLNIIDGNTNKSDADLTELIRQDPENEHMLYLIAHNLIEKKKYKQAEQVVQELIRIDPQDQDYIDLAIELRSITHWSAAPNWLINRFGWPASIAVWVGFIVMSKLVDIDKYPWMSWVFIAYLVWVIYSWVHPSILKRWLQYKGL